MTNGILLDRRARERAKTSLRTPDPGQAWSILGGAGAMLALVGWTDVALLWVPPNFGNVEWEFATLSGMFDALPLATLGLVGMAAGAAARDGRRVLRAMSIVLPCISFLLLGAFAVYALGAVVAWQSVEQEMRVVLLRALVKTSVVAVLYIVLYGWLGLRCARTAKGKGAVYG